MFSVSKFLGKKLNKEWAEDNEETSEKENQEKSDDTQAQIELDNRLKKFDRKQLRKRILIYVCIGFGVLGAIKSFAPMVTTHNYAEVEAMTFVQNYSKEYFHYPKTDEEIASVKKFTLQSDWDMKYGETIEYAYLYNIEIYKVVTSDEEKGINDYYCYGTLNTKEEKQPKEVATTVYFKMSVAKDGTRYLVVEPVANAKVNVNAIVDEDKVDSYRFEGESASTTLEDSEKDEVTRTINLFLKTYNDDIKQARLLCTKNSVIDELDPSMKLELLNVTSASSDDETIYVYAEVKQEYDSLYSSTRKYYFEIDKEKNKVKRLEVY